MKLASAVLANLLLQPQTTSREEYDLAWRLPHDRAALYEVYDARTGARRQDFCLLACELDTRVGATDTRGLPFRYIFKRPPSPLKIGAHWPVQEVAFYDMDGLRGVAPLLVSGSYKFLQIKKGFLHDLFKTPFRNSKDKSLPVEVALISAELNLYRCNVVEGKGAIPAEERPSAKLSLLIASRPANGTVLAARYQWIGREEFYTIISDPTTGKANDLVELALKEPLWELSREAFQEKVDTAINNGISYLKSRQAKDGRIADNHYPVGTHAGIGATAMALMALLHSGVSPDDPAAKAAFSYITGRNINQSYDLSLCLMALEAKYLPMTSIEDIERFSEDKAREEIRSKISKEDALIATEWTKALQITQNPCGLFGYASGGDYPNFSSTQYSILGLKSSSRLGIHSPPSIWRRTLSYIKDAAQSDQIGILISVKVRDENTEKRLIYPHGWGYIYPAFRWPTATMTSAALSTIAICESELVRSKDWTDRDSKIFDSLAWGAAAWIQKFYSIRSAPPEGTGWGGAMLFYHLYGLERACILWDIQKIGGHDWFLEGTALLLSWQNKDGSWTSPQASPVIDTAWALLFLKRATVPVDTSRPRIATFDNSARTMEAPRRP